MDSREIETVVNFRCTGGSLQTTTFGVHRVTFVAGHSSSWFNVAALPRPELLRAVFRCAADSIKVRAAMNSDGSPQSARNARYRLGADIGGTFTDIVLWGIHDGSIRSKKVLSTPENYGRAVIEGVVSLLGEHGIGRESADGLVHATTVASNTVIEHRGARTALLTTKGFRDILEMRRLRIPVLYDLQYQKPMPLVPRRHRFEIPERIGPRGQVWSALDEEVVEAVARSLRSAEIESAAICFLHSYANPAHEHRAKEIVSNIVGDDIYVTCSADVLPEIREYERMSTTVVNAYLGPVVERYLDSFVDQLRKCHISVPVEIMQSGGGRLSPADAVRKPAYLVESGPAAGVIASAWLARSTGCNNLISFDMGGTTAKAAMIEDGQPVKTAEYEVGGGINLSSKLIKGGGYPVRLPVIDVSEIGAGGGSIISVDEFGVVGVGPQSAGAVPGPVCYDAGGKQPTLTDALLVLGYLNRNCLAGGALRVNVDKARRVFDETIARPLRRPILDAAFGIFTLAVATMTRAVKAVSTWRGRDPREFILCGFGGNGPVTAVGVARVLQISRVLIPPSPGVFSALGLLFSDTEQELVKTILAGIRAINPQVLEEAYISLEAQALQSFSDQGYHRDRVSFRRLADMRYTGQAHELTVNVPIGDVDVERTAREFVDEHQRTYGHASLSDPVDIVSVRVVARVAQDASMSCDPKTFISSQYTTGEQRRQAYFGDVHGLLDVPVVSRLSLGHCPRSGPLLIDEYDSTCLVPPGCQANLDRFGNVEIQVNAE